MGLFKKINCAECGVKTNIAMMTKLADGDYICSKCKKKLPGFLVEYAEKNYSIDDYKYAVEWKKESFAQYSGIFKSTTSYGGVSIDAEHGLFSINYDVSIPLKFDEIIDFAFKAKEGILGDKVTGNIFFYYETILEIGAKAKAKKSFFGTKVTYDHPERLKEFEMKFIAAYIVSASEYNLIDVNDLKQSMTLFMIDDLRSVDVTELTATRDALLNSFQGKANDGQIAIINDAYELLRNQVGR
jgi:hypothetical protein